MKWAMRMWLAGYSLLLTGGLLDFLSAWMMRHTPGREVDVWLRCTAGSIFTVVGLLSLRRWWRLRKLEER